MAKNLVVVESPAKAKTINKILGKDYVVRASMGHIRDLPRKKLGVDVEQGFQPEYVKSSGKSKTITELRKYAKDAEYVYLAPDPDREGEAIAWHLQETLLDLIPKEHFYRVTYNQITPKAIKEAFNNPSQLDMNKVNAQQARRVLDRIVGYQVSPLLWRRIRGGSSAGRVQTVALRLVCEREREIMQFKPEKYWLIGARLKQTPTEAPAFDVQLSRINGEKAEIKSAEEAEKIQQELEGKPFSVLSVNEKTVQRKAPPPFITSTLQQAGSSAYGFTPKRTMNIAQKLYEGVDDSGGLITYMRTDSPHLAPEAIEACRQGIEQEFGKEYLPEKANQYKGKSGAQEAHEAIRPTDMRLTPSMAKSRLNQEQWKIYDMIWRRTMASQMKPAKILQRSAEVLASADRDYIFRAGTSEVIFPGYQKLWGERKKKEEEKTPLPNLKKDEMLNWLEWLVEEKETQPPRRYSEAALIKALEDNGVGRPSTYASIISTITDREYVVSEKRALRATELGLDVNDFLIGNLDHLFDVGFTASLEEKLDQIEEGSVEWTDMLRHFYKDFIHWVEEAKTNGADQNKADRIIHVLEQVQTWKDPVKQGRKTYDDRAFVQEMKEARQEGGVVTDKQLDQLERLTCRYREQIQEFDALVQELALEKVLEKEKVAEQPPEEATLEKMHLLDQVQFDEPRKVGKRTYDDSKFLTSLKERTESGRRLTEKQLAALNQLVIKYREQIPEFEQHQERLGLQAPEDDHTSGSLLKLMESVTQWAEPVTRGKRTYDDQEFYQSLATQYKSKGQLTPRQVSALKRMMSKYAAQIPQYEAQQEELGLPAPKTAKKEQ